MLKRIGMLGVASLAAAIALTGCTQQSKEDYSAAGQNLSQAAKETGKGLKSDAEKAGAALKTGTAKAGDEMANDAMSAKVQEALIADKTVKINDLKVDTNGKTVTVQGTVSSADQKSKSTDIAKDKAGPGYIVVNKMKVSS